MGRGASPVVKLTVPSGTRVCVLLYSTLRESLCWKEIREASLCFRISARSREGRVSAPPPNEGVSTASHVDSVKLGLLLCTGMRSGSY
jgi:hypothetical protein